MGGLNRGRLSVQVGGPWRLYTHPLAHWEMLGVVRCADGWTGALARSPAGLYACINDGAVRQLDQRKQLAAIAA